MGRLVLFNGEALRIDAAAHAAALGALQERVRRCGSAASSVVLDPEGVLSAGTLEGALEAAGYRAGRDVDGCLDGVHYLLDQALEEPRAFEVVFEALAPHVRADSRVYVAHGSEDEFYDSFYFRGRGRGMSVTQGERASFHVRLSRSGVARLSTLKCRAGDRVAFDVHLDAPFRTLEEIATSIGRLPKGCTATVSNNPSHARVVQHVTLETNETLPPTAAKHFYRLEVRCTSSARSEVT